MLSLRSAARPGQPTQADRPRPGCAKSISQASGRRRNVRPLLLAGRAVNSLAAAAFALAGAILGGSRGPSFRRRKRACHRRPPRFQPRSDGCRARFRFLTHLRRVAIYAMLGTLFHDRTRTALNVALTPFAIPALTAPFVLVTWIFLLPRQCLEPSASAAPKMMPRQRAQPRPRPFWKPTCLTLVSWYSKTNSDVIASWVSSSWISDSWILKLVTGGGLNHGKLSGLLVLALLMWLAYRGWSVLMVAPVAALLAAAISGEPLIAHWTQTFMPGAGRFVTQWFPMFLLGGLFGKLMDDSGSITSIARFLTERLGTRRTILSVVLASAACM